MTALALSNGRQPFARTVNTGSSPSSKKIENNFRDNIADFRNSPRRERAFSELAFAVEIGKEDNWDQYGAAKVDQGTHELALRFLSVLPFAVPVPEVGLDPDGEISFEWFVSKNRQFSVSLSSQGRLSYAGVFGIDTTAYGTEQFDETIPQAILASIYRLGISQ